MTRAADRWDVPDLLMNDIERAIAAHGAGSKVTAGYAIRYLQVSGKDPFSKFPLPQKLPTPERMAMTSDSPMAQTPAAPFELHWERLIRATAQRLAS